VRIPVPHQPLCGERVLVMQRLDGTPLSDAGPVLAERGLDRQALARQLLASMLAQVMLAGIFHADPHPGNVLVLAASDTLLEVMLRPDEVDQEGLERALGQFMARYLSAGASPGVRMFSDLFRIVTDYGLSVPPEVAAVFRALAVLEGTLAHLAPEFDLVTEARTFAAGQGPGQIVDPATARQLATDELTTLLPMLRRLPRRLERIASAAEHGRLSVHVRLFADYRDRRHITGLLHQVLLTILAATAGIMAVLLLGTAGGPSVTATVSLYQLLGYNLLVVCAILALRVLVLIFRPDR
jgi:ubiquinone biosynthesis protein